MKLTKNVISKEEAKRLAPDYVAFLENDSYAMRFLDAFNKLKKGDQVVTRWHKVYFRARVTSVDHKSFRAIDGPVVRVSNGEWSWRVDGCGYAGKVQP